MRTANQVRKGIIGNGRRRRRFLLWADKRARLTERLRQDLMGYCNCLFAVGICCCGLAIGSAELSEFKRPSAPACFSQSIYRDFGPPAGCDNDTSPHSRTVWMTSLTASTNTAIIVSSPLVAYTAHDAEDAAETSGPGFEITVFRDDAGGSTSSSG